MQPNNNDCGVYSSRFGYGVYRLKDREFTYREVGYPVKEEIIVLSSSSDENDKDSEDQADSETHGADGQKPFEKLISDNPLFSFAGPDIDRLRAEMSSLFEKLSEMFMPLKAAIDKREAAIESKGKHIKRKKRSITPSRRKEVGSGSRPKSAAEYLRDAQKLARRQFEEVAAAETFRAQAEATRVQSPPREENLGKRRKQTPQPPTPISRTWPPTRTARTVRMRIPTGTGTVTNYVL
jgi:hypothetical protein